MPLISLIHPSRGRCNKSYANSMNWIERAGQPVELIVSVDVDDIERTCYTHKYKPTPQDNNGHKIVFNDPNSSVVGATNKAAELATGDIMLYLSDDFDCQNNWADIVLKEFSDATGPRLIKVDDCLQPFHVPVLTIPIMNRALYERLGYFFHPRYRSMFVDCDLFETVHKLGAMKLCPNIKFEHKHVSVGKADGDETYRRSSANWNQGKEVFEIRKRQGFPV